MAEKTLLKKNALLTAGIVAMLVLAWCVMTGPQVHAITMEKSAVTIASPQEKIKCSEGKIEKFELSKNGIVEAEIQGKFLNLKPLAAGTVNVTVTGKDKSTAVIAVTVDAKYMKGILAKEIKVGHAWYGTKKIVVTAEPVTTGKVVIGGTTYKFAVKAGAKTATVKLKKVYPLNKAYKVYFTKYNVTVTKAGKLKSATRLDSAFVTGKKVELKCYNLHKGDKVKVTFKKKTYTKKIGKNYDGKQKTIVIKLKKAPKYNSKLKVKIINKDKKKLYLKTIQLSNFAYYRQ